MGKHIVRFRPSALVGGRFLVKRVFILIEKDINDMGCACKNKNRITAKATPSKRVLPSNNGRIATNGNKINGSRKTIIRRIGH